ncbi:MAG: hypothetical protein MK066_09005 [Crocinitomicaceae bacterium]|nr:hypothetical protein [Crocinitomicaceae bacterium]
MATLVSNSLSAQGKSTNVQPVKFAVFIIDGFSTKEEAHLINDELKTSPGVQMSRVDVPSQRCYVIFDTTTPYNESWFSTKISQLGSFSVHCYYDGIHGEIDFIPLTQNDCPELN